MCNNPLMDKPSSILHGTGREIGDVPDDAFREAMRDIPAKMQLRLSFMSPDHHAVRDFVVREIPRESRPIAPATIAQANGIPLDRVNRLLDEMEKQLFFLVRDAAGDVSWAFPVTASPTPHRLLFSSGERTFGA